MPSKHRLKPIIAYLSYVFAAVLVARQFPMCHCPGNAHDWFLKDLNTDYWKSLKPTS